MASEEGTVYLPNPDLGAAKSLFKEWQCVDICSGLGGFSLGARFLGIESVGAIDNWDLASDTYEAIFPDSTTWTANVSKATERKPLIDVAKQQNVDVVFAGPPCQGFTQIRNGQREGNDPRIAVTHGVVRALGEIQPSFFLVENVPMMQRHRKGEFFQSAIKKLAGLKPGYEVSWGIYNAASFGVPQQRRRLFIFGVRSDQREYSVQLPQATDLQHYFSTRRRGSSTKANKEVDKIRLDANDARIVTVSQALGDLPDLEAGARPSKPSYRGNPNPYQELLRGSVSTPTLVDTPRMLEATRQRLFRIAPGQCLQDLDAEGQGNLKRKFFSAYRRLHPDLPATTLFTKIDCAYHHEKLRALSVREYARLQSIPDDVEFPVANRNAYKMIGNSVPPLMVARLFAASVMPR